MRTDNQTVSWQDISCQVWHTCNLKQIEACFDFCSGLKGNLFGTFTSFTQRNAYNVSLWFISLHGLCLDRKPLFVVVCFTVILILSRAEVAGCHVKTNTYSRLHLLLIEGTSKAKDQQTIFFSFCCESKRSCLV